MIYDCFMFYNELDLLEIRLNELNNIVDKFIISECTRDFADKPKELLIEKNKERFKDFWHKIEYVIITENDLPDYDAWTYENFQRDVLINSLKNCKPDDIIIISDLDEIPDSKVIKTFKDFEGIKVFEMKQYNFYLNFINSKESIWKRGTRVFHYKDLQDKTLTEIRFTEGEHIQNAGWHFSFIGGVEKVKEKIKAFSHQEYNNEYYTDTKRLEKLIKKGKDIFERGYEYKIVKLDNSFPQYILNNKKKFKKLILEKTFLENFKNLFDFKFSKKSKRKNIETYKTSSQYEIFDFIKPNAKIVEIGSYNQDFSQKLRENFNDNYHLFNIGTDLLNQLTDLDDNLFDYVIFNDTFCQIYDTEKILNIIKQKLNKNGCIIATIFNIRYIEILKQLFIKKRWNYENVGVLNWANIRFYCKKSLEQIFNSQGYYFITFKGLNPTNKLGFKLLNFILFNNLNDCKNEKFLILAKY